ncbi:Gfo/Idh/MocA family oxidoreductase [Nitrososphaera sp.]|uniref:Gfo/Idh/MocA family protein n=1 Tax=Nitrososphaera sp. TaxID=1971748 RepID=UPI003180946B
MTDKISIGVIGCGYWGFNHVRIFGEHPKCSLAWCSDLDQKILHKINERYPSSKTTKEYKEILDDKKVNAICISSPAATHFDIAREAIENGKHVLIEKPLTTSSATAKKLVDLAAEKKVVLMPGHVYMFNPAVKKLKSIISSGEIGDVHYVSAIRAGFGPIRKDVNAMWDLAPHDIYTISHLLGGWPISVTASGASFIRDGVEDVVFVSLRFNNGAIANIQLSWINPTKTRLTSIVGSKKMIQYDDVTVAEKVKIYNKTVSKEYIHPTYADFQLSLVDGDVYIPSIPAEEPLKNECDYFLDCVAASRGNNELCADAVNTIAVLEAATRSLGNRSIEEKIEYPQMGAG